MSAPYDCQLTVAIPGDLEEDIVDVLRNLPDIVSGFSMVPAEGFGAGTRFVSTLEQVRGRARRRLVFILLPTAQVDAVLAALRQAVDSPEVAWWTQPVQRFGRLG